MIREVNRIDVRILHTGQVLKVIKLRLFDEPQPLYVYHTLDGTEVRPIDATRFKILRVGDAVRLPSTKRPRHLPRDR